MAMYERRSSLQSLRRRQLEETASADDSDGRKLSVNPVGQWIPPAAKQEPIGAFEVSRSRRIAQVGIAVISCLTAAGIVFGFAALKPTLISQGVYRERCSKQELEDDVPVCYEQELRLNLMFTIAAVSTNVAALPIGTILDRFGPRIASLIGVFFLTLGALSMAFAPDLPFDAYIPGYLFIALGGPFVFISSFQLSNAFPTHSGLILALLTGAFDTSSAIFLAYRLLYQGSGGTLTIRKFFLIYLVIPAFILLSQIFIMPHNSYKTVSELVKQAQDPSNDAHDSDDEIADDEYRADVQNARREHRESVVSEITALLGSNADDEQTAKEEQQAKRSGVWGVLHGRSASQQIMSWWFVLITLFAVVQMTRINYFVATVWNQYAQLLHSPTKATAINHFFDIALPLGGIVAIPFIGLLLDHTNTPFALAIMVAIATLIGILGCIPQTWAAYANIVLFVLYRPLYYTAVSDYSAKVFGFVTFGKVYGLLTCLAGLFNFSQAGLDALTHRVFRNDPVPVNVLLTGVVFVLGTALVLYVWRKSYTIEREMLEEEAEGAREVQIPSVGGAGYGTT